MAPIEKVTIEANGKKVETTPGAIRQVANQMKQERLLDVPVSEAQHEAEHYATMAAFVRQKQEELKAQAEIVCEKLELIGRRKLSFRDEFGVRHTFEVVSSPEKLKYTKKGAAAS